MLCHCYPQSFCGSLLIRNKTLKGQTILLIKIRLFIKNIKMSCLISVSQAVLCFTYIIWSEVSAQCTDPLIYKLNDIQQLIANMSAKQVKQEANLTYCTAQIEKQEKETANLTAQIESYREQQEKQEQEIANLTASQQKQDEQINSYREQLQKQVRKGQYWIR